MVSSNDERGDALEDSATSMDAAEVLRGGGHDDLLTYFHEQTDLSRSTQRIYRSSWEDFREWCRSENCSALPATPDSVADYLQDSTHLASSTLKHRLTAIRFAHRRAGFDDPTTAPKVSRVKTAIHRINRSEAKVEPSPSLGYSPEDVLECGPELIPQVYRDAFRRDAEERAGEPEDHLREPDRGSFRHRWEDSQIKWASPYVPTVTASSANLTEQQRQLIPLVQYDLVVIRDRAILLLMATGKVLRSEIPRINCIDVAFGQEEYPLLEIEQADTERADGVTFRGIGIRKKNGMPDRFLQLQRAEELRCCPARAVAAWIVVAGVSDGPLFRSFDGHENIKNTGISAPSINLIVERWAEYEGLNPADWTPTRLKASPQED